MEHESPTASVGEENAEQEGSSIPSVVATKRTLRRKPGTVKGAPVVYGHVAPEAKAVIETMSKALKLSQALCMEAILLALPLDEDGVPLMVDRSRLPSAK